MSSSTATVASTTTTTSSGSNACHRMKISFRCKTCGEIFPTKTEVESHLESHAVSSFDNNNGNRLINSIQQNDRKNPSPLSTSSLSQVPTNNINNITTNNNNINNINSMVNASSNTDGPVNINNNNKSNGSFFNTKDSSHSERYPVSNHDRSPLSSATSSDFNMISNGNSLHQGNSIASLHTNSAIDTDAHQFETSEDEMGDCYENFDGNNLIKWGYPPLDGRNIPMDFEDEEDDENYDDDPRFNHHFEENSDDEEYMTTGSFECVCGQAYLLKMSFEAHKKVCTKILAGYGSVGSGDPVMEGKSKKAAPTVPSGRSQSASHMVASRKSPRNQSIPKQEMSENILSPGMLQNSSSNGIVVGKTFSPGDEKSLFKRELIEQVHADGDPHCKACNKPLKGLMSICGHISRRLDCRGYYLEKLLPHIAIPKAITGTSYITSIEDDAPLKLRITKKSPNGQAIIESPSDLSIDQGSQHQSRRSKSSTSRNDSTHLRHHSTKSNGLTKIETNNSTTPPPSTLTNEVSYFGTYSPDEILIGPDTELIERAYLVRNSVQCPRCQKIFRGKTPAVAYNNHRRNKHCPVAGSKALFMRSKTEGPRKLKNDSTASASSPSIDSPSEESDYPSGRHHYSNSPAPSTPSPVSSVEMKPKMMMVPPQHIKYFCKLCRNREVKNRVSLGVHLTTYHGLLPVNITVNGSPALRCQTCTKEFVSKYFYNMHRYECDLTSPFIGISFPDGTSNE